MTPEELEGCAGQFLREAGMASMFAPKPATVLRAASVDLIPDVPRGARGWASKRHWAAHYCPDLTRLEIQTTLAYEGSRFALWSYGVGRREHPRLIPRLIPFWLVPSASVHKAIRRHGLVPSALVSLFKLLSPTDVLLRFGYASESAMVLHTPAGRFASSCYWREFNLGDPFDGEQEVVRSVRETGEPQWGTDGVRGWPYRDYGGRLCVAVTIEIDAVSRAG